MENRSGEVKTAHGKLFLFSLVMSNFATGPITVVAALLLIDIGNSFNTPVGVTGQINTVYSFAAVFFALLMGVLTVRFKHKSLLLAGLALIGISAVGCFLAQDFVMMIVSYSLSGVGFAMVSPMAMTLVGENFPLEKRANAVGWIVAGGALVYVVGAPIIASISGAGNWRMALLVFVVPVLLVSILLSFLGLPSFSNKNRVSMSARAYLGGYKQILSSKSACACLIGDVFRSASFVAIVLYATSFARQRFSAPTDLASIILLGGASSYALGSLSAGWLVNRVGRKSSAALTALLSGVFTVFYVYAPMFWLSVIMVFVASWFFGMVASSANSLILEQFPTLKGTTMSIDSAIVNLGSALGTAIGGLALISFDYEGLGGVLGVMGVIAAIFYGLLTSDPAKK